MEQKELEMIPCKGCLLKAVCKQKFYQNLLSDCKLIRDIVNEPYVGVIDGYTHQMLKISHILKPSRWMVVYNGYDDLEVRNINDTV